MDYINRNTLEVKTHRDVCRITNASIPVGVPHLDWAPIKSRPTPEVAEGFGLVSAGVVEEGGEFFYHWTVEPVEVQAIVPESVSRFQGMAQLHVEGVLPMVEAYFEQPERSEIEVLAWKTVSSFERSSPLVQRLIEVLGWTKEKADQVFIDAGNIRQ